MVDRVVLRPLGWFLRGSNPVRAARLHADIQAVIRGSGSSHPQHAGCPIVLVLSDVDLAHSRTVHSRGVWCHACAARRSLRGSPRASPRSGSRCDRPWYLSQLLYPSLRDQFTYDLAVSHMTNTFRYKNVFVTSSVSHFHHDLCNVEPMALPLAQVLDLVASSLVTKTASPRAPAPLRACVPVFCSWRQPSWASIKSLQFQVRCCPSPLRLTGANW